MNERCECSRTRARSTSPRSGAVGSKEPHRRLDETPLPEVVMLRGVLAEQHATTCQDPLAMSHRSASRATRRELPRVNAGTTRSVTRVFPRCTPTYSESGFGGVPSSSSTWSNSACKSSLCFEGSSAKILVRSSEACLCKRMSLSVWDSFPSIRPPDRRPSRLWADRSERQAWLDRDG
jgi:hypothetical protein